MHARRKAAEKKQVIFSDEFYSDMNFGEVLDAVLIRSPLSHGRIRAVEFDPKAKIPEDCRLITGKDFPLKSSVSILGTDIPLLCDGEIRHKGEPVALLVGGSRETLHELEKSVRVRLDEADLKNNVSEFVRNYGSAAIQIKDGEPARTPFSRPGGPLSVRPESAGILARRKVSFGDTAEIFSDEERAAFIVEGVWKNRISCKSNKECQGAVAQIKGGNLHIFTPSKWISRTLGTVSQVTGFPEDKIFITRTKVLAESTNALWQNGILASLAAVAAMLTGKTVRLSLSRQEQEDFIENSGSISIRHKTAIDKNGILSAMDISIDYDAGSYNPFASYVLDRLVIAAAGIYGCKNVLIRARARRSVNPPFSQSLSMLDSQAFFAMENQIQKIAEKTGLSPVDLRQMNKSDGRQAGPFSFSFGRAGDAINAVAARSDFMRKYTIARMAEQGRLELAGSLSYSPPFRGVGMACAFEGSAFPGEDFEREGISLQVSVTAEKDVVVHALPSSPSVKDIWTRIILDNIDVDKRSIVFSGEKSEEGPKKRNSPDSLPPEALAGNASIKSILLKKCAEGIKRKKLDGAPFSVRKSLYSSKKKLWDGVKFSGRPFYNTAFGTCTVELELDQCTFRENLRRICVIIDGGRILDQKGAENAVQRAVQDCLATLVQDESLTCPAISVQFTQSDEEPKQIGALVHSILPAAYTSALSQALACTVDFLPLRSDSLFKVMEKNENMKRFRGESKK